MRELDMMAIRWEANSAGLQGTRSEIGREEFGCASDSIDCVRCSSWMIDIAVV